MDPADDLISQGDANTQLTWMDAKCNGIALRRDKASRWRSTPFDITD